MSKHKIPAELRYTSTHEWALHEDDNIITIGITEHAQELLGDMVYVELPEVGDTVSTGDELGVVESVKAASDFYAPLSGKVVAINGDLEDSPGLVNTNPYTDGWLVKIKVDDLSEYEKLLSDEDYEAAIAEEEE